MILEISLQSIRGDKRMTNLLSIITPTYNRAYILEKAYNSLLKQTSMEFEWIVIDDGSTDHTQDLLSKWQKEKTPFEIKYVVQENGGKHRALNRGFDLASGTFIMILDSDDTLTEDAVETIQIWIKQLNNKDNIAAVAGMKMHNNGSIVGGIPKCFDHREYIDVKNYKRRKYGLLGDKAEVYRADILREKHFKEFEGENFLSEDTLWNEIAMDGYSVRWYPKAIYCCEYLADGLTSQKEEQELKNFEGFTYAITQRMRCYSWLERLILGGYYYKIAKKIGLSLTETSKKISYSRYKILLGAGLRAMKHTIVSWRGLR